MKALLIIGTCLRLIDSEPWTQETCKIQEVGKRSYYAECVIRRGANYESMGYQTIRFPEVDSLEVVECPIFNWDK